MHFKTFSFPTFDAEWIHLLTKNFSTMNTKKAIFGILACLTLMAATAAPYATIDENQEVGIEKRKVVRSDDRK